MARLAPVLLIQSSLLVLALFSHHLDRLGRVSLDGTTDITSMGEERFPTEVSGQVEDGGTSWIVGEHREPMWSQAQTYACGTDKPCPIGKADQGHFFQR